VVNLKRLLACGEVTFTYRDKYYDRDYTYALSARRNLCFAVKNKAGEYFYFAPVYVGDFIRLSEDERGNG
jgi:hypothetical protein